MKGDFTRVTFDPAKQYSAVLMQQGRVQLDADWNEQAAIHQHYLRALAADLIGPFGGPAEKDGTPGRGFKLALRPADNKPVVLPGRYYVDGIAAENPREIDGPPLVEPTPGKRYLLYLDVWERHILHFQDELLREVALLGADTATRSKVVWQVRATHPEKQPIPETATCQSVRREWSRFVERWQPAQRGRLAARARPGKPDDTDPCLASPEARFRGENQLYRVEIHRGGAAGADGATFKWSADNGSVVFAVVGALDKAGGKTTVTLEHLGRADRSDRLQDDWVEVVGGEEDLRDGTSPLLKVESVDRDRRQVILKGEPPPDLGKDPSKPLMLRRWDHRRGSGRRKPTADGVYPVIEGEWLDLEDGVQIFFAALEVGANVYRSGDYWVIPARRATGDVEWPGPPDKPESLPPRGVEHHYAPLGLLTLRPDGKVEITDCRTLFGTRSLRLDTGSADWKVTALPSGPVNPPQPAQLVDPVNASWGSLPGASWISVSKDAGTADKDAGDYTFELRFDLGSCFHDAGISLDLLADNSAKVSLNGQPIGERPGPEGFKLPPTHIEKTEQTLFRAGENVLQVVVNNLGPGKSPTGFILLGSVDADGGLCR